MGKEDIHLSFHFQVFCSGSSVQPPTHPIMLKLLLNVTQELGLPSKPARFPKKQDIKAGLQLYAKLTYCSWESKLAVGFLGRLLEEGNLGSLLLATINTIQGDTTREAAVWAGFRNFYPVLEREFGLQYGKILLALASPEELQALIAKDWPYLDSYRETVDACLHDQKVRDWRIKVQLQAGK